MVGTVHCATNSCVSSSAGAAAAVAPPAIVLQAVGVMLPDSGTTTELIKSLAAAAALAMAPFIALAATSITHARVGGGAGGGGLRPLKLSRRAALCSTGATVRGELPIKSELPIVPDDHLRFWEHMYSANHGPNATALRRGNGAGRVDIEFWVLLDAATNGRTRLARRRHQVRQDQDSV